MKKVTANDGNETEHFYVIGKGLSPYMRQQLSIAFPKCILRSAGSKISKEVQELCALLVRVVIFIHLPTLPTSKLVRTSAIVDTQTVKVVGVHPECDDALYDRALEAEFAGLIDGDADASVYHRAALSVQRGELWFPRGYLSRKMRESLPATSPDGLSQREADILDLLASGITNQRIAERLFISRDTVRWHLRSIYTKLGVSDREAAYRLAKNRLASSALGQKQLASQ